MKTAIWSNRLEKKYEEENNEMEILLNQQKIDTKLFFHKFSQHKNSKFKITSLMLKICCITLLTLSLLKN